MSKLICIVDLPKPVHGMSNVNKMLVGRLGQEVVVINSCPSFAYKYFGTGLWFPIKFFYTLFVLLKLFYILMFFGGGALYRPINGGLGQLFDVLYIFIFRVFRFKIYIHHHSFQYINSRSSIFSFLLWLLGGQEEHITLGAEMKRKIVDVYGIDPEKVRIVSNSAFYDVCSGTDPIVNEKPVIGHMANLCVAKGLKTFVDLCIELKNSGVEFSPILAGPVHDDDAKKIVESYVDLFGGDTYLGAIYGEDKSDFFSRLDVFVFMSEYANEAEPLVLYEAAEYGAKLYSSTRGCMADVTSSLCGSAMAAPYSMEDLKESFIRDVHNGELGSSKKRSRVEKYNQVILENHSQLEKLIQRLTS